MPLFKKLTQPVPSDTKFLLIPGPVDDKRFATGRVTYTRHDDSTLQVPFSVILKMQGDLIDEYLIFVDTSELYKQ